MGHYFFWLLHLDCKFKLQSGYLPGELLSWMVHYRFHAGLFQFAQRPLLKAA